VEAEQAFMRRDKLQGVPDNFGALLIIHKKDQVARHRRAGELRGVLGTRSKGTKTKKKRAPMKKLDMSAASGNG